MNTKDRRKVLLKDISRIILVVAASALMALNNDKPDIGKDRVLQLISTMDEIIPIPERPIDKPFVMSIESTYNIEGRGTVVVGTVE